MTPEVQSQLARHAHLADFLRGSKSAWEGIGALQKRVNLYLSRLGTLPTASANGEAAKDAKGTHEMPLTGALRGGPDDRHAARERLIELLVPMAAALHLYLLDPETPGRNDVIAFRLDVRRPSQLRAMKAPELTRIAQLALDQIDRLPSPAALTEYGMTAADIQLFEDAAAAYGLQRRKAGTAGRSVDSEEGKLEATLDELNLFVVGELRKGVDLLRTKNPQFVRDFKKAYQAYNRPNARTGMEQVADPKSPRRTDHDIEHS